MTVERVRQSILAGWFVIAGLVCALLIAISLIGTSFRGIEATVWLWFGANYLPTLILMLGWLRSGDESLSSLSPVTSGAVVSCHLLALFYLLVATGTILIQPFSPLEVSQLLKLSYSWLTPLQAVIAVVIFMTLTRAVRRNNASSQSFRAVSALCVPFLILSASVLALRVLSWWQSLLWLLFALVVYPPVLAVSRAESISGAGIIQLYQSGIMLIVQLFGILRYTNLRGHLVVAQAQTIGDIKMGNDVQGDHIEVSGGQVASIGRNNDVHDITMTAAHDSKPLDLSALSRELALMREQAKDDVRQKESAGEDTSEHDIAIGSITAAKTAAEGGDENGARKNLAAAGKWALDLATKIGASLATEVLKKELGMK